MAEPRTETPPEVDTDSAELEKLAKAEDEGNVVDQQTASAAKAPSPENK